MQIWFEMEINSLVLKAKTLSFSSQFSPGAFGCGIAALPITYSTCLGIKGIRTPSAMAKMGV